MRHHPVPGQNCKLDVFLPVLTNSDCITNSDKYNFWWSLGLELIPDSRNR